MNHRSHSTQSRPRRRWTSLSRRLVRLTLCLVATMMMVGCQDALDDLLAVEVPGSLLEADLNDPALAETLALGVVTDFECAFVSYAWATGTIADEFWYGGATNNQIVVALRLERQTDLGQQTRATACTSIATFLPLHTARRQGVVAIDLLEGFPDELVPNKNFLIAKARVFEAYSILLLGEAYCEMTIDGQVPPLTREQTWEMAKERFTQVLNSGVTGSEAEEILNLARVGRARTNLNLVHSGQAAYADVLADVQLVPDQFWYDATYDASPGRRNNTLQEGSLPRSEQSLSVHGSFHDLEVAGVPDPRVQYVEDGLVFLASFPMYRQLKYETNASPIPIANGREARLMEAEALGGAAAVTIINDLRATVSELPWVDDSHPGLPAYGGGTDAEIFDTVREERRRELWLQGHRIGDKLRYDEPWETGLDPHGREYGPLTCIPLHDFERQGI